MNRIAKTLLAAVAATTALGAQAWADTRGETFTFRVEAASLTSDVQVRTAYQRLGQEADRYCRALGIPSVSSSRSRLKAGGGLRLAESYSTRGSIR